MSDWFVHPSGMRVFHDSETDTWTEFPPKPSWWTPDRMEAAVSIFCILFAALLGYALGAR